VHEYTKSSRTFRIGVYYAKLDKVASIQTNPVDREKLRHIIIMDLFILTVCTIVPPTIRRYSL
jgi:hypothetical protein